MAEKILNTRILLKHATLDEWNSSSLILKKGEVAFATVPTAEGSTLEPVMFKVGDGSKTFAQLDWASAKAADVYGWAKAAGLPVDITKAPEGQFVEGFAWENNKLVPKFRGFITEINEANKDKLDAPTTKAVKDYVDSVAEGIVAQGTIVAEGAKIDVAQTGNTYTVSHEEIEAPTATAGEGRTYLTGVTTDGYGHITSYTTATESDQDLSGYKTKQTPVVATENDGTKTVKISQNENGEIVVDQVNIAFPEDKNETFAISYDKEEGKIYLTGSDGTNSEIPTADFIKDGMINTVTIGNDNDLIITFNTDAGKEDIVLPLDQLVDIYTGSEGTDIKVTVTSDKKIEANLTGTIKNTIDNKKEKQTAVNNKITKSAHVLSSLSQNANGDITYEVKELTPADIGAQPTGDYALKSELPIVNNGKFTVSGTGMLTGSGEMTANQAGDTTATLDLTETAKTSLGKADTAIQEVTAGIGIKAVKTGTTVNLELVGKDETDDDGNAVTFILDCGGAE